MQLAQKTIKSTVSISGTGIHSGDRSTVTLLGATSGGVVFNVKNKSSDKFERIPAKIENLVDSRFKTVLSRRGSTINTVEHILASVSAHGIDHISIQVDGDEIPILDGSAKQWVELLNKAGEQSLNKRKKSIKIIKPVHVSNKDSWCRIEPGAVFSVNYTLSYSHPAVRFQQLFINLDRSAFVKEISESRTFGFIKDIEFLKSKSLARGAGLHNTLVFDETGVVNQEGLRHPDEPVRHKILDVVGDLALAGYKIEGNFVGFRSGHQLNHKLVSAILADRSCYKLV
jgi:UDP-3-O-[3-hydroxymyristoyl] N-acetylglucosamine deacetylase